MADDFLHDVRNTLARAIGTSAADVEILELRERWGGFRPYIPKAPVEKRRIRVEMTLGTGGSLEQARQFSCSSTRTLYRVLALKR